MRDGGSRSGFSLIEALFASAVLVAAIVPATLAFHAHLAAMTRLRQTLDTELTLENLQSQTEQKLLFSAEEPASDVTLAYPIRTVVSSPELSDCGTAQLIRQELSAENAKGTIRRDSLLYVLRITK